MRIIYFLFLLSCFSCTKERVLQLPEIENANVTEVSDVSPAYIFYDETQPDSTLLNRKNLIITTNWLVNVDKRLTLRQALPHIKFLQDKKRNAEMHKNEDAKNYFSCNATNISNLGFIEFTDVIYSIRFEIENNPEIFSKNDFNFILNFMPNDQVLIENEGSDKFFEMSTVDNFENDLIRLSKLNENTVISCYFHKELTFQDYISLKSRLLKLNSKNITLDTIESVY